MRSFKNFLSESGVGTSDQNMAADMGINPSEIQNPKVLKTLNAYIGAIANMEYMLPEHALNKLREKLGKNARETILIRYSTEVIGKSYLKIINDLIGES